ncbi:MAG: FkbM family methyltransferase [Eubacteriales bacterium]
MGVKWDELSEIYEWLEDELSKRIYEARVLHIITGKKDAFIQLYRESVDSHNTLVSLPDYCRLLEKLDEGDIIIFYGAGQRCRHLLQNSIYSDKLQKVKVVICDEKWNEIQNIGKYPVISMSEVQEIYNGYDVIITPLIGQIEIKNNLIEHGFLEQNIHFFSGSTLGIECEYFDKILALKKGEIFVDAGVYDGMTSVRFAQICDFNYNKIWMFEPDGERRNSIEENIEKYQLKNTVLYNSGLWYSEDILSFDCIQNGSSKIQNAGELKVIVTDLDSVLKGEAVTYIKMDIEGAELEALKGARQTILRYKPKLAICIYHKSDDIIDIPIYIKSLVPEYKFYIRHYSEKATETVLYAIT